ncbi:prepilin-type N-terminal cleavage/methylation domain-containing protein [Ideonella livida]|uniref:Prepilin-type N-terminal cleavage/methylation domain-containing protein n=1 Tax=Ideonella livida TaxID=2707176 RepID=A0A7C9PID6_9BURK|nr:prepilin-type N-terminal cleavage/methylation domain-containing protein [Ideonella livida]NDY92775.1 prepilin-type N-terminal cleavage/methylation domain-containing protein [Ideonella livida]
MPALRPPPPAHAPGAPRRAAGFTLVEVLVALFILSIVALLSWRGVDGLVRARDAASAHGDAALRLGTVVGQWEADLTQLQRSATTPTLRHDGAALRLVRRHPQGLQVVVWTLQDGRLWRWASPPQTDTAGLQRAWQTGLQWTLLQGQALPVLEGVSAWQVYYYRSGDNAWSNAQSSAGRPAGRVPVPARPASGASSPDNPGEPGDDGEDEPAEADLIPSGVRLQLSLPAGVLTRDLMLPLAP